MKLKHYIVFALFVGLFTTCKKFPDDPFISLNTVKDRLKGTWKFESIRYCGDDYTSSFNDTVNPYMLKDLEIGFNFHRSTGYRNEYKNDMIISNFFGYFYFDISKKNILFRNNINGKLSNLFLRDNNFSIRELYKNKFKIRNNMYEIAFRKINNN